MSDMAFDRGVYLPGGFTDWYRERPFQIAFATSVVVHALLIALVPGLRSVRIDVPPVLNVEIVLPEEKRPVTREARAHAEPQPDVIRQPEFVPPPQVRPVEPPPAAPEPVVEPLARPAVPEVVAPVQRAELAPPVARELPRPEPITLPRPDPRPEQRMEIPLVEPRPVPQVQPTTPPPPVARVEPRPEPQLPPRVEPRPEFVPEPIVPETPPAPPVQRPVAPVIAQPAPVEPAPAPAAPQPLLPAPPVAIRAQPPVAAPVPPAVPAPSAAAPTDALARQLTKTYSQQISTQIKRYQRYPIIAQRRGWEGTAEVLLKIAPDGRVTEVALGKSTGRDVLDREAMEMVRRAFPLPQAPQQLRGRELSVTVPIIFRLQES
jgi:protein TonB